MGTTVGLYLGIETVHWTPAQFTEAAAFAGSLGVTVLAVKCADGGTVWYDSQGGLGAIRIACLAGGVDMIPYAYSYGGDTLQSEIDAQKRLAALRADGLTMLDAEAEWDGHPEYAQKFAAAWNGRPPMLLTTWANVADHNWVPIIQAFGNTVSAWIPQEYDTALVSTESQWPVNVVLQPALNLPESWPGPNDPVAAAKTANTRHHDAIWLWEYQLAVSAPSVTKQVTQAFLGNGGTPVATVWWAVRNPWQNIKVIDEFGAGHNDDCGPNAEENGVANLLGRDPTYAEMDAIRTRDLNHTPDAWFTAGGGNTIANINSDVVTYFKLPTELHNYHEWYTVADIENLCNKYHGCPIVVGICQAFNLPFNEAGVHCHYVVILAWDSSTRKVLVGNGDRQPHGGPDWYSIDEFADAQPYGMLVIFPVPQEPTMIVLDKDASGNVIGAHDQDHPEVVVGGGVAKRIQANNQLDHHIVDLGGGGRRGERSFGSRSVTILSNDASADSMYSYSAQFGVEQALGVPDLAIIQADRILAADQAAANVATAQQQIAQLTAAAQAASDQIKQLTAENATISAQRDDLQKQLDDCKNQTPPAPTYSAIEQAALDLAKAIEGK